MSYRYCANGKLTVSPRYLDRVCRILSDKAITYATEGTTINIKHDVRTAMPSDKRPEEAFEELAPFIDEPQALTVYSELLGESEVGFISAGGARRPRRR